ncbi:AAA family ATPase [Streptomyces gibsoniae]|uniref:AAA family ATPase n=1 Tax=Streptomyces gibsoniae TaxID=3075529 RepID=A0ABU2U5Q1_9ACTN|nr:AAA family ATPase [Streptomyces sp. DSM 41699]MDT0468561.1 AAA family ATPase [Streptomyces sp. DSM 41699]
MGGLFGRGEECGRLREVLDHAGKGMSGVLMLRGAPGAGKSALLDHVEALAATQEFEVMRFDAVESEAELGFAALHQLLRPYVGQLEQLPSPQRDALARVFGLQEQTSAPDRFLVALAALGLLAARPGTRPLLCLVDDAHWLDQESAEALSFIARRLYADSVAMVFAVRDGLDRPDRFAGLPTLAVPSLPLGPATLLLEAVTSGSVDSDVCTTIVASTGGNPLALIEAARELSADQLKGHVPLPDPVPVGQALERTYLREVLTLPPMTRTLLLVAAADSTGDPNVLWRAGTRLDFDANDAAAAEERNLLTIRNRVRFRHPLIRSAVYYGVPLAQRATVHSVLAAVAADLGAPDLRAWHLSVAATDPDETVALELERAAERSRAGGGWAAGSTLLARAAALSAPGATRARRLLRAAETGAVSGLPGRAQELLDEAVVYRDDRHYNGLAQRVQARVHRLTGDPAAATRALLAAARDLGATDTRLARDVLVEALVQAQISGSLAPRGARRRDVAEAARALPLPSAATPTTGDAVLDADTALHLEGLKTAAPELRHAIAVVRTEEPVAPEFFQWLAAACSHATMLGDDNTLHELAWRMEAEARHQGAVIPMALALSHTAVAEMIAGRLAECERQFDRRAALEEARGSEFHLGALLVAAWRGRSDLADQLSEHVTQHAARTGQGYQLIFRDYARCVLALGEGRYHEAYTALAGRIDDTLQVKFALADLVEAAVRSGRNGEARALLARLTDLAEAAPVPGTRGDLARARALLAAGDPKAEAHYQEAIARHETARGPARRARSHQVYGEWLRRERRTKEARHQLRIAHELFDGMGANAFAARTAQELSAAGDPVESHDEADRRSDLTPQEARVAHLAASGATNAEIASQLFLSVHTVDYHLRKVFRKLGIRSRRDLAERRAPDLM